MSGRGAPGRVAPGRESLDGVGNEGNGLALIRQCVHGVLQIAATVEQAARESGNTFSVIYLNRAST